MIATSPPIKTANQINLFPPLPDHTQLPEEDGKIVNNFQEHPQSLILTDSLGAILQQLHPDGQYCIGQDCGIYWRQTDPPLRGVKSPDWFYVPNVSPLLNGKIRRSYVLWKELVIPPIVLEFASEDGDEERDTTPNTGKFWVYEKAIGIPYYGIYEIKTEKLEMYFLQNSRYHQLAANSRGHYPIPPLGVELGLWRGTYQNQEQLWLRWWDLQGNLLLIGNERAEIERDRAETERDRAEIERHRAEKAEQRAARLAQRLRAMGVELDAEDIDEG